MVNFGGRKTQIQHEVEDNIEIARAEAPRFEKVNWRKEPHLRKLYIMTVFLLVASATTGYDGMLANTCQQMDKFKEFFSIRNGKINEMFIWDDKNKVWIEEPNKLGIAINMFNIGSIVSFFITPYLADLLGRKPTIMIGCVIMVVGGCLTAFTTGWAMFMGGRFVLGFGNSLAQMCSPLLLTEICHPQHRGPLTAVYNCLWNLGSLIVSVIGWGTSYIDNHWSWKSITLVQIVPSLFQLCGVWWLPESPRFLVSKDKTEKAFDVLVKHHGGGNANNATVQFEYREIKETIAMEAVAAKSSNYIDFLRTKGNRWRLAIVISLGVISQYSGNAILSNYINVVYEGAGITSQNQKLALSTGRTIMDLIVSVSAALTVDKFGRRPLFLLAITGMVVAFVCWTITGAIYENSGETNEEAGYTQIVFVWIFGFFYDIGFSGLLVAYALEILPFHLRAKGMMILNITIQAFLALGNQTNLLAWQRLPNHWNLMLFYTLWDFCELVFVWFFYVETKGPTLEEIARIFDGDAAVVHIDLEQVEKELRSAEYEEDINLRYMHSHKNAV